MCRRVRDWNQEITWNNVHEYSTIVSTVLPGKTDFGVTDFGQSITAVTFVLSFSDLRPFRVRKRRLGQNDGWVIVY